MRSRVIFTALITFGVASLPSPALGGHSIKCSETTLLSADVLDASGYPASKHRYAARGFCKLFYKIGKRVYAKKFIAEGSLAWDGTTGSTVEKLIINGQTMKTDIVDCVKDPFVEKVTCTGADFVGDPEIKKAVVDSQRPVFAGSLNLAQAVALSKKKNQGGLPPPPKITLDLVVSRPSVHSAKTGEPVIKRIRGEALAGGSAGVEYQVVCRYAINGSTPATTTRIVFKANGVVVGDQQLPVDMKMGSFGTGVNWKPTSVGTYSMTCEVNPDHKLAETNYANNRRGMSFPVNQFAVQLGALPSVSPPPAMPGGGRGQSTRKRLLAIPTPTPPAHRRRSAA